MNKNFLMATIAGGITLWVLGFVIYGVLLADFSPTTRSTPSPSCGR